MALKENAKNVFYFVKEHDGENFTAADIAEALDLRVQSVNGIVTAAFQKKGLMKRTPAEIEVVDEEGNITHKLVKFISLTDEGREFDPEATEAATAPEAE